jgi:hypothetical protein
MSQHTVASPLRLHIVQTRIQARRQGQRPRAIQALHSQSGLLGVLLVPAIVFLEFFIRGSCASRPSPTRSAKSATVVPTVVVATIVAQYSSG